VLEVNFERSVSDDGIHPDYNVLVTLSAGSAVHQASFSSPHHGGELGKARVYRELFGLESAVGRLSSSRSKLGPK
jgi:hypothetical protein